MKEKRKQGLARVLIAGIVMVVLVLGTVTMGIGYREFTAVLEQQYNDTAYEIAETARA